MTSRSFKIRQLPEDRPRTVEDFLATIYLGVFGGVYLSPVEAEAPESYLEAVNPTHALMHDSDHSPKTHVQDYLDSTRWLRRANHETEQSKRDFKPNVHLAVVRIYDMAPLTYTPDEILHMHHLSIAARWLRYAQFRRLLGLLNNVEIKSEIWDIWVLIKSHSQDHRRREETWYNANQYALVMRPLSSVFTDLARAYNGPAPLTHEENMRLPWHMRRWAKDLIPLPPWPSDDIAHDFIKLANGNYRCFHQGRICRAKTCRHVCCLEGTDLRKLRRSISEQKKYWGPKVERLVANGRLDERHLTLTWKYAKRFTIGQANKAAKVAAERKEQDT